jgi:hypothetical protein
MVSALSCELKTPARLGLHYGAFLVGRLTLISSSMLRHTASRRRVRPLASPIITLAIAIVARSLRSINPSWPKAPQTPPTCLRCLLAQTNDRRARAARKQLRLGCLVRAATRLVSLGFRVGNPSAIGWYQPANFLASLLSVGGTPTTSRRIATRSLRRTIPRDGVVFLCGASSRNESPYEA